MVTLVFKKVTAVKPNAVTNDALIDSVTAQLQKLSGKRGKSKMEYTILNATTKEAYDTDSDEISDARQRTGDIWKDADGNEQTAKSDGVLVECHNTATGKKAIRKFGFKKIQ